MDAMDPPGTYSMKMFTTPPSKQVPMNLTVIVRTSFTNDKKNKTAYVTKFMLMVKGKNARLKTLSLYRNVLRALGFFLLPSLKKKSENRKDLEHLAPSNLKSLCSLNLPPGSSQIISYRSMSSFSNMYQTKT